MIGRPGTRSGRGRRAEAAHEGKRHVAKDVRIIWAATDRLKDEIAAGLARGKAGDRTLPIPRDAPPDLFAEYTAERRDRSGRGAGSGPTGGLSGGSTRRGPNPDDEIPF